MSVRWDSLPKHLQSRVRKICGGNSTLSRDTGKASPADDLRDLLMGHFAPTYRIVPEYRFLPTRKYRIDFAFPDQKVAIEFDGYRSHGISQEGFRQGLRRQNALVCHGWRVLRYPYWTYVYAKGKSLQRLQRYWRRPRALGALIFRPAYNRNSIPYPLQ